MNHLEKSYNGMSLAKMRVKVHLEHEVLTQQPRPDVIAQKESHKHVPPCTSCYRQALAVKATMAVHTLRWRQPHRLQQDTAESTTPQLTHMKLAPVSPGCTRALRNT